MRKYQGIRVKQRSDSDIEFIMFAAPAKEIVSWCHADDIRIDAGNVQRELIESRWKQVKKFFSASENNIIPTSVTVAFDGEAVASVAPEALSEVQQAYSVVDIAGDGDFVEIQFPDVVRDSAFIIDGQHRLKGMSEVEQLILVPVCLFPSLSRLERAFQFVTINNKSHKVPTDNLKALIRNFENIEVGLRQRLSEASITATGFATFVDVMNEDSEGPFFKLVDWVNNRHEDGLKLIAPAAIENSIRAVQQGFPETKQDGADSIVVLSAIWRAIFDHYRITRANVEQYQNLTKKAVIQRVTEMVVEHLVKLQDPAFSMGKITKNNAEDAAQQARRLVTDIPAEFWAEDWKLKGLDTGAGREIISQSIRQLKNDVRINVDDDAFDWRDTNPLFKDSKQSVVRDEEV